MGARVAGLVLLAIALPACQAGDGKGSVSGSLFLAQCELNTAIGAPGAPAAFDLKPTYFVADPIDDDPAKLHPVNRVSIRVQSSGNRIEEADGVLFTVADVQPVGLAVGQALPLGPSTNVRASLSLRRTCPATPVTLELDGSITFTQFGTGPVDDKFAIAFGDPITATFSADIVDRRALTLGNVGGVPVDPQVGGHLDGNFDFVVRKGSAAQSYP